MKNNLSFLYNFLRIAAIAGNLLFILWILYNGINEGFQAKLVQKVAYLALLSLLATNSFLLLRNRKNPV